MSTGAGGTGPTHASSAVSTLLGAGAIHLGAEVLDPGVDHQRYHGRTRPEPLRNFQGRRHIRPCGCPSKQPFLARRRRAIAIASLAEIVTISSTNSGLHSGTT